MASRNESIYGALEQMALMRPDKTALICLGERFTYSALHRMVLGIGSSLHGMGVREGDRVLLYLYNLPQTIAAYLALHRIHAVPVPVAPVYTAYELRYFANDIGAETVFCMDSNLSHIMEILPETGLKRVVVTNVLDCVPWWKRGVAEALGLAPKGRIPREERVYPFRRVAAGGRLSSLPPFRPPEGERLALMLYTGGTTGEPKGVPLSMDLFLSRLREWRRLSETVVPPGEMVTAQAAPFYHIIGQMDGLTPLLVDGGTLVLFPRVHLDALMDHIARHRITNMFAVPAMYRMILESDRLDNYDLGSLRYCGCGGDVLPVDVARRWLNKFGVPLSQGYGVTEACGAVSATYAADGTPPEGSVGKVVPENEILLVDPETLSPVPAGSPGELLTTVRNGTQSYWNKPEETADSFIPVDGRVWYRTRDVLRADERGWLFFMDRSADMIKHKGYRIAAAEIEKVLQEHTGVIAACAVGVPDALSGERIKAFVVLREDAKGVNGHDLKSWCRERLASYKVPHYIEFRDMLPKSKVGKMLRREMRQEELKKRES
jgi:long-chain acyl-CoA synthetase